MQTKKANKFLLPYVSFLILIMSLLVLSACSLPGWRTSGPAKPSHTKPPSSSPPPAGSEKESKNVSWQQKLDQQSKIKKFSNYDQLKQFLEDNVVLSANQSGFGSSWTKTMTMDSARQPEALNLGNASAGIGAAKESSTVEPDYSKTNVQVEGVDEADIIKTDGNYIYALAEKKLFIVKAAPADQAQVVSAIKFKNNPQEIYINGNYLVVYGRDYEIYKSLSAVQGRGFYPRHSNYVFLKVFDISDKKNPRQVRDLNFEGRYISSRLIGDYLYFITSNYVNYYFIDEAPVPRILVGGQALPIGCSKDRCYNPPVYYIDIPNTNYNFVTVAAINVKDNSQPLKSEVYLLPASQNVYVSPSNIYLTYTKYISEYDLYMAVAKEVVWPLLSPRRQKQVIEIESAPNYILSPAEKQRKISALIEYYLSRQPNDERDKIEEKIKTALQQKYEDISKELQKTIIHKIAIAGPKLNYQAQGEVTGRVLNQFSMNEDGDYFYIATTRDRSFWPRPLFFNRLSKDFAPPEKNESYSNLYVLNKNLKIVGSLEKLAPGEKIYSARFMQKRAYLVTFRRLDPLFVIDLSKPTKPRVLGKLKIPGYSDYLHPYDDTTLIGLGKETATSSWGGVVSTGLKISLFDVSDVTQPKEVAKYVLGERGSDSEALRNHKAFSFWPQKHLLVIPVVVRESRSSRFWGRINFAGAAVFAINKSEIKLKGKISHQSSDQPDLTFRYTSPIKRALYIGDVLYTFSNQYLGMNRLTDLELIKDLPLKIQPSQDFEIIN